jgi:hypothetical protein
MDKSTAQRIVRDTFKAPFDRKRYRDFINELCNGFDEDKAQTMRVPDAFTPHVKSCQRFTNLRLLDYTITVNVDPIPIRKEIVREEKAHERPAGDYASEKKLSPANNYRPQS